MNKLFSTQEAAEYLGMTISGVKYHVYESKLLKGQLIGKTLVFTQKQLDNFKNNDQRPAGRPRKETEE